MTQRTLSSSTDWRTGRCGGRYVPEPLVPALTALTRGWHDVQLDVSFQNELSHLLGTFAGRPTPLHRAERFSEHAGHAVYIKREDLLHTGGHKITSALGQALLARRLGFSRLIAETASGQHGLAVATVAAQLDLDCTVHMAAGPSATTIRHIETLGAEIRHVIGRDDGVRGALACAMRDWMADPEGSYFLPGSCVGPAPLPSIVGDLQTVIGREAREQLHRDGAYVRRVVACIGGGANAWGMFEAFLDDEVELVGVEAGNDRTAPLTSGADLGILHGAMIPVICDLDGHVQPRWSISEGLRYPGAGPQHAWLREQGRAHYAAVSDDRALAAYELFARCEGVLPAIEAAYALAWILDHPGETTVVCLSGRGEKDLGLVRPLS